MTVNETIMMGWAGASGAVLGTMFFGGLWWTVRKGASSPRPVLWFLVSLVLRMSLALMGFYLVGRGHWERLAACLLGFIIARVLVTWLTRPPAAPLNTPAKEARHAS